MPFVEIRGWTIWCAGRPADPESERKTMLRAAFRPTAVVLCASALSFCEQEVFGAAPLVELGRERDGARRSHAS